jgi:betaine-aldehyde dehydrogenase
MSWKLGPCLVAGNTIVLKPAPTTPFSSLMLADLTRDIFPPGVINIVCGEGDVGSKLVQHPMIKMVSFTGSTKVGQSIAIDCAKQLKPCTLELGGKNACVVFDDADIPTTVDCVVDGAFCIFQ